MKNPCERREEGTYRLGKSVMAELAAPSKDVKCGSRNSCSFKECKVWCQSWLLVRKDVERNRLLVGSEAYG